MPETWLCLQPTYRGSVTGTLSDPKATVTGTTEIEMTSGAALRAEVCLDGIDIDEPGRPTGFHLWNPIRDANGHLTSSFTITPDSPMAKWERLELRTEEGVFESHQLFSTGFSFGGRETKARLAFRSGVFRTGLTAPPALWVLPLTNFLSEFNLHFPDFSNRPLRLHPQANIPADASNEERQLLERWHERQDCLIAWRMLGGICYIERLPDYKTREERLKSGQSTAEITAVAVGPFPADVDPEHPAGEWFPFKLLTYLSLATGRDVGAPWLEVRSADGGLIRREHLPVISPRYFKGHPAIDELHGPYTGPLVEAGLAVNGIRHSHLRALIHMINRIGDYDQATEERWTYAIRAFEYLTDIHGIQSTVLYKQLPEETARTVRKLLEDTAGQIRSLAGRPELSDEARLALERMAERTPTCPTQTDLNFGLAVRELLKLYGLTDGEIMDRDYAEFPRNHGPGSPAKPRSWTATLNYYRTQVLHRGFVRLLEGEADEDFNEIPGHLHDILLRIVFKQIGYTGPYQSPVQHFRGNGPQDWVTPKTRPEKLGYRRRKCYG